ncbi:MAG: NapH/MauN family ferredoxin-type protein [Gammaproteobacteria bacterium]
MSGFVESLRVLFGKAPARPDKNKFSDEVREMHKNKKNDPVRIAAIHEELAAAEKGPQKWRRRRWTVLIVINLLFVLSYQLDISVLEGALTGSRFVGFHMADLNSALQVMLAYKHIVLNLVIGTVTVFIMWWLLGGRTFCSWVCPYHLIAEWAEMLHLYLAKKGLATDHPFDRRTRTWFWIIFVILAVVTGYTVYETVSPTGILSRALIYGPGLALIWVALLLLFEIFYSRRAWCRYGCPIGLTYGLVGAISPFKVQYHLKDCLHEGECRKVCMVPHVLETVIKGKANGLDVDIGADCTRCGRCVEVCPTESLTFLFKGIGDKL